MPSLSSIQDCLSAAVRLKSVLIKSKPGRQEWEQAPPFLRCTAAADDTVQRARTAGFSIQYSTALQFKGQGNELINKDPAAALECYTRALSVFLWFDRGQDRASEDVPLVCSADGLSDGPEKEQAHHMLALCFSNAAACLLQLDMGAHAIYACSKALEYDPYSVKALYRRALAHRKSATTADLEAAVADLAAANQLEPANNQVRLALAAVQHELREHRRQERGIYGKMFERGELYRDCTTTNAPRAEPAAAGGLSGNGSAATAATASDAKTCNEDGADFRDGTSTGGGNSNDLDPEDLLFLDPQKRKAEFALASREADLVMRKMQAALARSRNRKLAERLDAERARRLRATRFPWWSVPWWAYALIALHLAYRLIKVWRIPFAPGSRGLSQAGGVSEPALSGFLEGHVDL